MDCYQTLDITPTVKAACRTQKAPSLSAPDYHLPKFDRKITTQKGKQHAHGFDRIKTKTLGKDAFVIDRQTVDLRYVEQIADYEQTAFLAQLLKYVLQHNLTDRTLHDVVAQLETQIKNRGLSSVLDTSYVSCGFALPRTQEIFACFNRYRA